MTFHFPIKVYYNDTDAMGLVYHANYLKYFDQARTEILNQHDVSCQRLAEQGYAFVVTHVNMNYIRPALLEQSYQVVSQINNFKRASIIFKQKLIQEHNVYSEAQVKIAHIELNSMKPCSMPKDILSQLKNLETEHAK